MFQSNAHQSIPIRTGDELRAEFERLGVSVADWARSNGFSSGLVYQILAGKKRCLRGQSHQIAVRLGLKHGGIGSVTDIGAETARDRAIVLPADQPSGTQASGSSDGGESS